MIELNPRENEQNEIEKLKQQLEATKKQLEAAQKQIKQDEIENRILREKNKSQEQDNNLLSQTIATKDNQRARKEQQYQRRTQIMNKKHNKKHARLMSKAKAIRAICFAEAAALVLSIGVPAVINTSHRREGSKQIVAELEEQNLIPKNLKWIETDDGPILEIDGEPLNITKYYSYICDIAQEAFEDGCPKEKYAVALKNSDIPMSIIKDATGCDREIIKAEELRTYYEQELANKKGVGRN